MKRIAFKNIAMKINRRKGRGTMRDMSVMSAENNTDQNKTRKLTISGGSLESFDRSDRVSLRRRDQKSLLKRSLDHYSPSGSSQSSFKSGTSSLRTGSSNITEKRDDVKSQSR